MKKVLSIVLVTLLIVMVSVPNVSMAQPRPGPRPGQSSGPGPGGGPNPGGGPGHGGGHDNIVAWIITAVIIAGITGIISAIISSSNKKGDPPVVETSGEPAALVMVGPPDGEGPAIFKIKGKKKCFDRKVIFPNGAVVFNRFGQEIAHAFDGEILYPGDCLQ